MNKTLAVFALVFCSTIAGFQYAEATNVPVTFTQLSNLTGGSPAATAVYRANLSGLGITSLQSLTILDNSPLSAGSPGQFSGFDLDAVKLVYGVVTDATLINSTVGQSVFDFTPAGTSFTPGIQAAPTDPKLFGTGPSGNTIDNAVATLASFDGNSTTAIPGADGFVSMGFGGKVSFNLTSPLSLTGLYLYIGEVGDNGEVAAGTITISDAPVSTPEPFTILMLGFGLVGLVGARRFKK